MSQGYIKLYRSIQDHDFWKKEKFNDMTAWIDLLLLANYKEGQIKKRGIRIELKRGEVGWSEVALASRWKWSRGKVRRFLNYLFKQNMIQQIRQQNKFITTHFKIVNYKLYQDSDTQGDTEDGQQTDSKRYRNNKDKKGKKDKKKETTTDLPDFIDFQLFENYKEMRKKIKKPMTAKAEELVIAKLSRFNDQDYNPNSILEESIQNSWQGVFEPKQNKDQDKKTGLTKSGINPNLKVFCPLHAEDHRTKDFTPECWQAYKKKYNAMEAKNNKDKDKPPRDLEAAGDILKSARIPEPGDLEAF